MKKNRHIILLSTNKTLAKKISSHLSDQYGLLSVSAASLSSSLFVENTVTILQSLNDYDALNQIGYIVNLDDYDSKNTDLTAEMIFEEASEHFIGELSIEELAYCA